MFICVLQVDDLKKTRLVKKRYKDDNLSIIYMFTNVSECMANSESFIMCTCIRLLFFMFSTGNKQNYRQSKIKNI